MQGYVTKLKKIIKIVNSQENKKGLLELSHMRAEKKPIFKSIYGVQKFLM